MVSAAVPWEQGIFSTVKRVKFTYLQMKLNSIIEGGNANSAFVSFAEIFDIFCGIVRCDRRYRSAFACRWKKGGIWSKSRRGCPSWSIRLPTRCHRRIEWWFGGTPDECLFSFYFNPLKTFSIRKFLYSNHLLLTTNNFNDASKDCKALLSVHRI